MFTGIITETGTVVGTLRSDVRIHASRTLLRKLKIGASIAVDGTCLTVTAKNNRFFIADMMPETAQRTTLSKLRTRDIVNLELPATPTTFLSGHIVQGHVDGVGTVRGVKKDGTGRILSIEVSRSLSRYIAEKGSVAVNGISLTVAGTSPRRFSVGIIPHTWKTTTLGNLAVGDKVNIETDALAKYAASDSRSDLGEFLRSDLRSIRARGAPRIGIIGSSFREEVTRELEKRCIATLKKRGVPRKNIEVFRVPGSMEIPLAAKKLAKKRVYDALIVFGAIVKGETYHFEQIANECARGCMQVSLDYELPVMFEVLAVYDLADALERATRKKENKGVEAAESALAIVRTLSEV